MSLFQKLNDKVSIFYQVMDGGGVISARDFVFIGKNDYKDGIYVQGSCSVDYPDCAEVPKIVRAWHGPCAVIVKPIEGKEDKCELVWLMDSDYRGWIPSNILQKAMPQQQMQFVRCVRKLIPSDEDAKKDEAKTEEAKTE